MSATIVVSGAIANKYRNGGATWTRLNWLLGFQRLGFDVVFVEQIAPGACVDENGRPAAFHASANLAWLRRVADEFGFPGALILDDGSDAAGIRLAALAEIAAEAALLVNISGHLRYPPLFSRFARKAYVDLDPGFTQIWHATRTAGAHLEGHDAYFTVGENIGRPGCTIPRAGLEWRPTRQPVVLDLWPVSLESPRTGFTTVASWRGPYGPLEHDGRTLGLKVHQFRRFLTVPRRVDAPFELALDIHAADEADRVDLERAGWTIVDPVLVAGDTERFQRYVRGSTAEFSVAQGVYVDTGSGWFSDRTVRYLASGRPALVQDTGFSANYPVGDGLVAFRTLDEAVGGARDILAHYDRHARAARALAEDCFDSNKVLSPLVERLGVRP